VFGIDLLENARVRSGHGGDQQGLETIRDAGERGMNDHRPERAAMRARTTPAMLCQFAAEDTAGAAELEAQPRLDFFQHSGDRTCDFNSASPSRAVLRCGARESAPAVG